MATTNATTKPTAAERASSYQFFMLALCAFALLALAVDRLFRFSPEVERLIRYADFAVCVLFLLDFGYQRGRRTRCGGRSSR